jgi:hypothetical protein
LLDKEIRCPDIHGEELVEILDRQFLDRCGLGDAGVGYKNVEPAADDFVHVIGEFVCTIRGCQVDCASGNSIG